MSVYQLAPVMGPAIAPISKTPLTTPHLRGSSVLIQDISWRIHI